jgi:predicted RNase H-like nuclease (RuvC/YqgF family)|tara:strand:- start:271 stop:657 length:387 start_codon:yes stop_codon:yes gene_type:complete
MKNKDIRTYLFWAILGIFVGYVIFGRGSIKVDVKKYEAQINALNLVIDSAKTKNLELESKVKDFEKIVFEANTKITRLNNRIYIIKKETDEKINAINNLNNDELYQFFTERYRQYLDSIGSTNSKVSN